MRWLVTELMALKLAARLDRSQCLATDDYKAIAMPRVAQITTI